MNIALAHFRVGETDGVSLEMEKWRKVLERMGHRVIFISGTPNYGEICIPEMDLHSELFEKHKRNSYERLEDYESEEDFRRDILRYADIIEKKLDEVVEREKIDLIIPNNIFSLGVGLPIAIAFHRVIKKKGLKVIGHHHDFYWERENLSHPTCDFVRECLDKYFPPLDVPMVHVVINKIAQKELKKRKGVDSIVVPNVLDFEQPLWVYDDFNKDLRERIGLNANDIVVLQATRVTERKAIEISIEFVGELQRRRGKLHGLLYDGRNFSKDDRITLLMPGLIETGNEYVEFLKEVAKHEGVEILWINSMIDAKRSMKDGEKKYSLWDTYVVSDIITYPSVIEGWGNQFLEGIFAKKPLVVFEYPVYKTDIKDLGFEVISLGDVFETRINGKYVSIPKEAIIKAVEKAISVLKDGKAYKKMVEKNFELGKKYFSYRTLESILSDIIKNVP